MNDSDRVRVERIVDAAKRAGVAVDPDDRVGTVWNRVNRTRFRGWLPPRGYIRNVEGMTIKEVIGK
jgi:hypothetical protein